MAAAAAAADSVQRIKAEATCSICLGLLRDPLTNECGHSFCKPCITQLCKGREAASCPQCRRRLQKKHLRPNRDLKNIAEILRSQAAGKPAEWNTCERHQQPLQLYCKEDQSPICLVCMQSKAHRGHTVAPMDEALQEYKGKMAEQLEVIESCCGKLDQFVSEIWKHLPENEREEEHRKLARVCEKLTDLKVRTGTPRQRPEDPGSQSESEESLSESEILESDVSKETERQGHSGREPGSEPADKTREETGSHVSPVGKEDATRKCELSQGSLDEAFHRISGTRGEAEPKVDTQQAENRDKDGPSQMPAHGSGGSRTDGSSASRKQEAGKGAPARGQAQSAQLPPPELPPPTHQIHPLQQPLLPACQPLMQEQRWAAETKQQERDSSIEEAKEEQEEKEEEEKKAKKKH